jgi:hypothetical protein
VTRRPALLAVIGLLTAAGTVGVIPATLARFTDASTAAGVVATGTLLPPTVVTATGGATIGLAWTPTLSTYASGYEVLRSATSGSGHTVIATVTPWSAVSAPDDPGTGTWYYLLRSTYQAWRSATTAEVAATVAAPITTPLVPCTTTAADTSGAGDNNGYQSRPARACVDDSSDATDSNSGTGGTASCGTGATPAATKDRHRFWGFAHGVPGSASAIEGITVRVDLGLNNMSGTTNICAQLSWNGGSTWTTIKSLAVAGAGEQTYTFGGATDTWGRAWTAAELAPSSLRVRLIDASSLGTKRFDLDYVALSVTYRP